MTHRNRRSTLPKSITSYSAVAYTAAALALALVAAACGSDAEPSADSEPPTSEGPVESAEVVPVGSEIDRAAPSATPDEIVAVVGADRALAADLYEELTKGTDGNVFFSPYSIAVAFSMLEAGANGNTEDELRSALGITSDDAPWHDARNAVDQLATAPDEAPEGAEPLRLDITNVPFGQAGYAFDEDYLDLLAANYGAGLQTVDYLADPEGAREGINDYVADQTEDRITDLLPEGSITTDTRLTLVNTVFFQGNWVTEFDEARTGPAPFTRLDGSTVEPEMMNGNVRTTFGTGDGWTAVKLPYWGGYSMHVIVPDDGRFDDVEAMIATGLLDEVRSLSSDNAVALALPKFSFKTEAPLIDAFTSLGVSDAFDEQAADLSGITTADKLFVSGAFHQATVEVDEKGTVATAATAIVAGATSAPEPAELTVDRPFIIVIEHGATGEQLFLGRVLDPTAG